MTGFTEHLQRFFSFLGERTCFLCHQHPATHTGICPTCLAKLETEATEPCPHCGEPAIRCRCCLDMSLSPLPAFLSDGTESRTWLVHSWYHPVRGAETIDSATAALVLTVKRQYSPLISAWIAHQLSLSLAPYLPPEKRKDWILTYAPRSSTGYASHGFDQCAEIVGRLGAEMGIPVRKLLIRCGGEEQKHMTDASERSLNISQAFMAKKVPEGCRVLLFDDIITTGATMREAGQILAYAGASCVFPLAFAKTYPSPIRTDKRE